MSTILDALKRKKPIAFPVDAEAAQHARADAHADTVLSTLGYRSARTRRSGLSVRMLLLYGVAAIAIGFVGLSILILLFAPPERPQSVPVATSASTSASERPRPLQSVTPKPASPPPPASPPSTSNTPVAATPPVQAPAPKPAAPVAAR